MMCHWTVLDWGNKERSLSVLKSNPFYSAAECPHFAVLIFFSMCLVVKEPTSLKSSNQKEKSTSVATHDQACMALQPT